MRSVLINALGAIYTNLYAYASRTPDGVLSDAWHFDAKRRFGNFVSLSESMQITYALPYLLLGREAKYVIDKVPQRAP